MSRKKLVIDWRQVYELGAMWATQEEVARVIGCSVDTLDRRCKKDSGYNCSFADLLKVGRQTSVHSVRRRLFLMATDEEKPNVGAAIFILKNTTTWRDNPPDDVGESPPEPGTTSWSE